MGRRVLYIILSVCVLLSVKAQTNYAPHGEIFTPKGKLRFLIICAGFGEADSSQHHTNWPADKELPDFISDSGFFEAFYTSFNQFEQYKHDTAVKNLSKLYYEQSNPQQPLQLIADVYPKRINIDPASIKTHGWFAANQLVVETMKKTDPHFDWSPYDLRTNRPNFQFDNTESPPDGKPDFVIIMYRYSHTWAHQPIKGMNNWIGTNNGASSLGISVEYNGFTIGADGFHVNSSATTGTKHFSGMFKHELGHELFAGPHYMGANGALGRRFYHPSLGWGSTVSSTLMNDTFNAWERWLLGWTEIKHDLGHPSHKGIYKLSDFATTGDALRIKIPHSENQYLWIENHQQLSVFDHHNSRGELKNYPKGSSGIGDMEKGVYMFVENMLHDRKAITTSMVYDMNVVNGVMLLNAQGNYDYDVPTASTKSSDWSIYWNNRVHHFKRKEANPFSGINPYVSYRYDFDNSGQILNNNTFNTGRGEQVSIVMEIEGDTNYLFYCNHGGRNEEAKKYRCSSAFQVGDVVSINHNPPVLNHPFYHPKSDSIAPVYLNGLRVEMKKQKKGVMYIEVDFDCFTIENDLRLAGNIAISNDAFQVKKRTKIVVDKSGTVSRISPLNGEFVNPTYVVLRDKGALNFSKKAVLELDDESQLIVENGAVLAFKKNAQLLVHPNAQLVVKAGGILKYHKKAKISDKIVFENGACVNGAKK